MLTCRTGLTPPRLRLLPEEVSIEIRPELSGFRLGEPGKPIIPRSAEE
jgi:hypothetical protein